MNSPPRALKVAVLISSVSLAGSYVVYRGEHRPEPASPPPPPVVAAARTPAIPREALPGDAANLKLPPAYADFPESTISVPEEPPPPKFVKQRAEPEPKKRRILFSGSKSDRVGVDGFK